MKNKSDLLLLGRAFANFFGKLILFLLFYVAYSYFQQACIAISVDGNTIDNQFIASASSLIFTIFGYFAVCLVTEKKLGYKELDGKIKQIFTKKNAIAVCLTFVALIAVSALENWLMPVKTANQSAINGVLPKIPLFMAVMSLVTAPITEELLFRKLIFNASTSVFDNRLSKAVAVIISAVVFSFAHAPTNIRSFIVYSSAGLVLALGYLKGNGLKTTLPVHFLNNFVSYIITFL